MTDLAFWTCPCGCKFYSTEEDQTDCPECGIVLEPYIYEGAQELNAAIEQLEAGE